jgi:hypothetical protein
MPKKHCKDVNELLSLLHYIASSGYLGSILYEKIIRDSHLSNFIKKPIVITNEDWLEVAKILED